MVLVAAIYDVRYRRIPNWLNVSGVLLGIALNTFLYQGLPGLVFSLKGLILAFGIYVVLYALHAMGAGDVKLMAAIGAIVGWENWFGIFIVTAVVGGIMSLDPRGFTRPSPQDDVQRRLYPQRNEERPAGLPF